VVYGDKKEPLSVHVEEKVLAKALSTGHFMNTVVMIDVGGKAHRTLPKDVQFHPVSDRPIHVDFLRIGAHSQVHVNVPVVFTNEEASPGIKRGGVLNIVRHDLELVCDAAEIPEQIEIDLTGLEIGDSVHISAIALPKGSKSAIDDRDFTIATVVAPSAMKSEEGDTTLADAVSTVGDDDADGEAEAGEAQGGAEA
jgi:large subunit ribosomal protein L25